MGGENTPDKKPDAVVAPPPVADAAPVAPEATESAGNPALAKDMLSAMITAGITQGLDAGYGEKVRIAASGYLDSTPEYFNSEQRALLANTFSQEELRTAYTNAFTANKALLEPLADWDWGDSPTQTAECMGLLKRAFEKVFEELVKIKTAEKAKETALRTSTEALDTKVTTPLQRLKDRESKVKNVPDSLITEIDKLQTDLTAFKGTEDAKDPTKMTTKTNDFETEFNKIFTKYKTEIIKKFPDKGLNKDDNFEDFMADLEQVSPTTDELSEKTGIIEDAIETFEANFDKLPSDKKDAIKAKVAKLKTDFEAAKKAAGGLTAATVESFTTQMNEVFTPYKEAVLKTLDEAKRKTLEKVNDITEFFNNLEDKAEAKSKGIIGAISDWFGLSEEDMKPYMEKMAWLAPVFMILSKIFPSLTDMVIQNFPETDTREVFADLKNEGHFTYIDHKPEDTEWKSNSEKGTSWITSLESHNKGRDAAMVKSLTSSTFTVGDLKGYVERGDNKEKLEMDDMPNESMQSSFPLFEEVYNEVMADPKIKDSKDNDSMNLAEYIAGNLLPEEEPAVAAKEDEEEGGGAAAA